tara:strand:- start:179 stop:856 length:678 start_codon:yes stop_codon:yes gene_type:complete
MKIISLLAMIMSFSVLAQPYQNRAELEVEAKRLSLQMKILVDRNVDRLDERDLTKLVRTLERSKDILLGRDTGPGPGPVPPIPAPRFTCDRASAAEYQSTFIKVKNFAYSSSGLDMSSAGATNFAQDWATRYSCSDADQFIAIFGRLKNFAYSTSGLDMSSAASIDYAQQGINNLCENYNFEAEYKNLYNFAYSTSGLDLSSAAARDYARQRVEPQMFQCRPFNF